MSAHAIDAAHLEHQRKWSIETFGPASHRGPLGPLAHIRKELDEIEENPTDLMEWVDVIILAFDGAWRAGHEPTDVITAIKAKQIINEARDWPDWRLVDGETAIEHVRVPDEVPLRIEPADHACDSGYFDRTVCPEPCGTMHSYCSACGIRQDGCVHDAA